MAYVFNPLSGNFDVVDRTLISSSDPASGYEGQFLINTTTNLLKVYYAGSWQLVATLTGAASFLLLETGDDILLETGDKLLLEDNVPSIPTGNNGILLESGDYLIGEDGGSIDLEDGGGTGPGVNDFVFIAADTFEFVDSTTFEVI